MSGEKKQVEGALKRSRSGRPTSSQAAEIDQRILTAGRDLFLSDGYAVTSMEAVALRASVSKGTLYARYSSKADLFRAITDDRMQAWSQLLPEREKAGPLADRLRRRAGAVLDGMRLPEVRAFERLASSEVEQFPELGLAFYEHGYRGIVESTRADLAGAVDGRPATRLDPAAVAEIFAASLIGWYRIESAMRPVDANERADFVDHIVALCMKGLDLE